MSNDVHDPEPAERAAGYLKYVPAMSFGLRVAALAGVVMTSGAAAAIGLAGVFDDPVGVQTTLTWPGSSCCPK
jgi:hypothetical protein